MRITMHLTYTTPDAHEAIEQTVEAFGTSLAQDGEREARFEKISELAFRFGVAHPLLPASGKGRASYHRDSDTFFAEAYIKYDAWIDDRWAERVDAVMWGAQTALAAVHKTRLTSEERSTLGRLIEAGAERLKVCPPDRLLSLKPVYAFEDEVGRRVSVSFQMRGYLPAAPGGRVRVLQPSEVAAYSAQQGEWVRTIPTIKLHKLCDGQLHYREAWVDGESVVEHSGTCGDRGLVSQNPAAGQVRQRKLISAIAANAKADGFRVIPKSRLAGLLVSKEIEGMGTQDDLSRRHALEDFLNEVTGWLGLGQCDGGSIGSGSMEAFCLVVDYEIAAKTIARELAVSKFSDFVVSRVS
jgi:hypothetical protein